MQICKTCRSLMIGGEALGWRRRLKRVLRQHGADSETLTVVADSLGPMCDKCREEMDRTIRAD